jgi:uncharacterized protein
VESTAPSGVEGPGPGAVEGPGSVAVEALPSVADGVERRLDPRVIDLERTVGWIVTAVVSFGMFLASVSTVIAATWAIWATAGVAIVWLALTVALGWWMQVWPAIYYRHASYIVDANGIEIRRGVVWRTVTNVPRTRVQHTDVSQGPFERRYGVASLVIHTAGTEDSVVTQHGLAHQTALAIRDHLLPREEPDAV